MPEIKELVKQLGKDQETAYKANYALLQMVTRASAPDVVSQARRGEVAGQLAAELNAKTKPKKNKKGKEVPPELVHSAVVRSAICRLLAYVGGAGEVPALVEALGDLEVREMARLALDGNRSEEATAALVQAVEAIGPEFRVGAINALGRRKGPNVVAALRKAAEDDDPEAALAAVEALANFADPSVDAVIAKAAGAKCAKARARANKARVRLAETLRKAGNKAAARAIYKAIAASDADQVQKRAAETGLKATV